MMHHILFSVRLLVDIQIVSVFWTLQCCNMNIVVQVF